MLNRRQLLALFQAFDKSITYRQAKGGRPVQGFYAWEFPSLVEDEYLPKGYLRKVGYASMYPTVDRQFGMRLVYVGPEDENGCVKFINGKTLAWERISKEKLAIFQVDEHMLFRHVAQLLEIDESTCRIKEVINDCLWSIGAIRTRAGQYVEVLIYRENEEFQEEIQRYVVAAPFSTVIMAASEFTAKTVTTNSRVVINSLSDFILLDTEEAILNSVRFQQVVDAFSGNTEEKESVALDAVRRVLSVEGKPDWHIRGDSQFAAVNYLFEQHKKGVESVPAFEILDAVKRATGTTPKRLGTLFQYTDWENYIERPKRGVYRFQAA